MKTFQDKCNPIYEGLPFQEIEGDYIPFPCVAEIKYDGEFQYLVKQRGQIFLANKKEYGRIRMDMPATSSIDFPENSIFLAELVWDKGHTFYGAQGFITHKLDPNNNLMVFGCLRYDGNEIWKTNDYIDTRKLLEQQAFYNNKVMLSHKVVCRNQQELDSFFNWVVTQGYEGIVIHDPLHKFVNGESGRVAKRKYIADNDFVIVGFQSGTARAKNLSVLVGHKVGGKIQRLTYVGGGFKLEQKEALLAVLKDTITEKVGDEYHVEPKIVITVQHRGVIRNNDGSINSLRHPNFKDFRFDKTVEQIDTLK